MGVFGNETAQATTAAMALSQIRGSRFTLAEAGSVSEIHAYLSCGGSGDTVALKGVVYAADDNRYASPNDARPGTRKGYTDEYLLNKGSAAAWVTLAFASPVALTPADYWLMIHYGGTANLLLMYYTASGAKGAYTSSTYSSGVPNPCPALGNEPTQLYSIHAAYSTASACPINLLKTRIFNKGVIQSG